MKLPDIFYVLILNRPLKNWLLAALVFMLSFLFKNVLSKGIISLVDKIFFRYDKLQRKAQLSKKLSWLLPLIALFVINEFVLNTPEYINQVFKPILQSLFIIWFLAMASGIARELLAYLSSKHSTKFNPTIQSFSLQFIKVILLVLGLIMILDVFHINAAGIITGLGIGGLAISMAAKDVLQDLIGGFTIMSAKVFQIGDYIANPDLEGTVEDIGFRQTQIRAIDQGLYMVPNSILTSNYVVNFSRRDKRLVDFMVYLPFFTETYQIDQLRETINNYLSNNELVLAEEKILAIESLKNEYLQFRVRYFISDYTYDGFVAERDLIFRLIWKFLSDHGLEEHHTKIEIIQNKASSFNKPEQKTMDKFAKN